VEPYAVAPWSKSVTANKAVLDGALRGYRTAGLRVGLYSAKALWTHIVGSARYLLPQWRTAGPGTVATARARCARSYSFQGGTAVLAQWWTSSADYDVTCCHRTPRPF
jgi:hypothetical protein